ncbi:hypothetical protein HG535_0G03390 [Zygotorulaspora mrakii]|uniref:Pseudouridine synthase RsuA/RluA-like domain-containing protein n=1 Tax=Zygotorulaspora mrakii TaxID=42260 RepID=A0A7H9B7X0_ZYGMR|nr:uncharacterized protein HG535_0G03390 [Zygotorulaspora mrakii]QLG74456.1 hypothetical protein HG535_0G03390 [Zygotorulaspora mrakii]
MKNPGMGVEVYFANGVRNIRPYYHRRASFAKGRWFKRTLTDVLVNEFNAVTEEEYIDGIRKGQYKIIRDGQSLEPEEALHSPIENSDIIETSSHKHEPPVLKWCDEEIDIEGKKVAGIDIVFENEDLLVLDKPNGIPIHPTGQFYQNTLTEILKAHNKEARPCYRLDKITSGLLIMAKKKSVANQIQSKIRSRDMTKLYLARVKGKFPKIDHQINSYECALPVPFEDDALITTAISDTYTIELKRSFPACFSAPKTACTKFYPLKYFPTVDQSLVVCRPLTGRTHQIRIHLARAGHPIVNDPYYNLENTKYPLRSKFILDVDNWENSSLTRETLREKFDIFDKECRSTRSKLREVKRNEDCGECGSEDPEIPRRHELELWLHAWKYSDSEKTIDFETNPPSWINQCDI